MGMRVSTIVAAVMTVLLAAGLSHAADLPLNAPLPEKVPPGTTLVVGGPTLETAFRLSGELQKLPFKAGLHHIQRRSGGAGRFSCQCAGCGFGQRHPGDP